MQDRELTLCGNLMYVREDVARAIRLLQTKTVPIEEIITATFDLADAAKAFRASDDPEQVKVLVTVGTSVPTTA